MAKKSKTPLSLKADLPGKLTRFSIPFAAEDDPIYKEGWRIQLPQDSSSASPTRWTATRQEPSLLTEEEQKLSALEKSALLHQRRQTR